LSTIKGLYYRLHYVTFPSRILLLTYINLALDTAKAEKKFEIEPVLLKS
jgi:hypothetical protein